MIRKLLMMAALPAIAAYCTAAIASPTINSFNADGMASVLASKIGRPFLLLVWSLDCTFCHASMANLAAAKHRGDFDVVSLAIESADEPDTAAAIVAATSKLGDQAAIWAFGNQPSERLRFQIDPKWHGELPRSYWYDKNGTKIASHSGLITEPLIMELGNKIQGKSGAAQ